MYNSHKNTYPGILLEINEKNMYKIEAVIIGPKDTPYEGAFLYFEVEFSQEYPIKSPTMKHLTTVGCTHVRLHPNLYGNGKVCLSILGTWQGEPWSPSMNLMTILVTIQSLLCKDSLKCEPGRENATQKELEMYDRAVEYECWNVGILRILEGGMVGMSSEMYKQVCKYFMENAHMYIKRLKLKEKKEKGEILHHLYGKTIEYYAPCLPRIQLLVQKLTETL